ncbi:Vacuolar amino acid transporter 5 [Nosema granulosis]|uniref:Vacuolar amino acid transporter 5 n=1 Tax=Nosema granulosis TaxID=83296 RepID=A0A9P6GYG6_9MICR|nr:Vacuolar amino acid transporter 5 [Nosema granulosis]
MNPKNKKPLTALSATSLLVTTMMGTGINFMPFAFNAMGYWGSWIALATVAIFTFFSLIALAYVARYYNRKDISYMSIAKDVSYFEYAMMNLGVFFNCFFATVTFFRFLTNILVVGVPFLNNLNADKEVSRKIVIFIVLPFLVHSSLKEGLVNLKLSGWLGVVSISFLMVLIIFYSLVIGNKAYDSPMVPFNDNYKLGLPFFVSCMICQPNMIEVYLELEDKRWSNIVKISFLSSLGGFLSYGLIGFCGYYIFGSKIQTDIMQILANMDSDLNVYIRNNTIDKYNILSRLCFYSMVSLLVCGFPMQMLPVAEMVTKFIFKEHSTKSRRNGVILSLFVICVSLVLIKNLEIGLIKRFSGAIFSTAVGLVHPFIFLINVNRKISPFTVACTFMGFVAFLSIVYTIYKLGEDIVKEFREY